MIDGLEPYPAMKDSGVPWLGQVPEHWEVRRLKHVCRLAYGDALATAVRQDGRVPVYGSNGRVGFHCWANTKAPCIVIGRKGSFGKVNFCPDPVFAIDTTFFVDRRFSSANVRWLYFLLGWLRLDEVSKDSAVPGLDREDAYQRVVAVPPISEQAAIVRFLDHADRRIRRYIRAKQKLIKLLEEQKQAIVHRAVTRGLDPNVRLKPSGVEWLGDVPEHWEVLRAKRVFHTRAELARPGDVQLSATQAYGVIAQKEFERRIGRKVTRIEKNLDKRRHVEIDDFVISMRSFQGGLERAWEGGCIRSSYVVLKPARPLCVSFFARLFKSRAYIGALQTTANFIRDGQDLNYDNFCAVDLPWPPLEEQGQIAAKLDLLLEDSTRVGEKALREVTLLREFRTRLIADVVTGKLDVREAAARLPQEAEDLEALDEAEVERDAQETDAGNGDGVPEEVEA